MAVKNFGTVHLYGVAGTVTNATVQSFSNNSTHAQEAETMDENGQVIELRLDDVRQEASISLRYQSAYTIAGVGTTLSYDGTTWIIMGVGESETNGDFRTVDYTIREYEYITEA